MRDLPKGFMAFIPLVQPYIFDGIHWQIYKALISEIGDDRAWRVAYAEEMLEIRIPLLHQEEPKGLIESFVETIADERGTELRKLGSLTLEREDLAYAVEPDSCFYIQNEQQVRGLQVLHFPQDPPPDLVIESGDTRSPINKFKIYAALNVPELWKYHRKTLEVYQLVKGSYERCPKSRAFPFLPIDEIPRLIEQSQELGQRSVVRIFQQRIRELL
jgi:Uma2 family endonuclease